MRLIPFHAVALSSVAWLGAGCASAPKPAAVAPSEPVAAAPQSAPAPVMTTPPPAEVSVQVRETRTACGKDAGKQGLEVLDFVNFQRLDENNWDATIRARRKGKIVRVGCRYDLRQGWTYVYEPAKVDGGDPFGNVGSASGTLGAAKAPASPGSNINLGLVADSTARTGISRTRDACLAEATRRKIAVEDFESFRRVGGNVWETQLVLKKGRKELRQCRLDLATGKATIK